MFKYTFSLLLLISCLASVNTSAQHFEAGVQAGFSGYSGDLTPTNIEVYFRGMRFTGGAFVRYNPLDALSVKLGMNYGRIAGDDAIYDEPRNLSFNTHILEGSLTAEWNILGYQPENLYRVFSPYVFAGVGFFNFNPKTEYQGEQVELQPLGTEGQGLPEYSDRQPYKLTEFMIPVGIGFKYAINDAWNVGIEAGVRITGTDYLDDVSLTYAEYEDVLRGNGELAAALSNRSGKDVTRSTPRGSENRDYYYMALITISYNFLDNGLIGSRNRSRGGRRGCRY